MTEHVVPKGIEFGVAALNRMKKEDVLLCCQQAYNVVQLDQIGITSRNCANREGASHQADIDNGTNVLSYFFSEAKTRVWDGRQLSEHLLSYVTDSEATQTIQDFWDQHLKKGELASRLSHPKVGKLTGLRWKLSVARGSSLCRTLDLPLITLELTIEEPSGCLCTQTLELSLTQFTEFSSEIKKMAAAMNVL